ISLPLTWFCMFDNEQGFEEMDAEFYRKLNGADDFTRESFSASMKLDLEQNVFKQIETPTSSV
ncbi:Inorganic phosphate transporter, partial [Globisporangium polare]